MELEVQSVKPRDAGKSIAYLDPQAMDELDVGKGDMVEIEGEKKTVAIAAPGYQKDSGKSIIRIDGTIRQNAETAIEDTVEVTKTEAQEAKMVKLAPLREGVRIRGGAHYIKKVLSKRPLMKGDRFKLSFMSSTLALAVTETKPDGAVIISNRTDIRIGEKSDIKGIGDEEYEGVQTNVNYEDIGGLDEELDQVREMIEMPLRNPEIFDKLAIDPPKGVILHGPPGTGKTLLAKAVANEVNANFIPVSGPEIMSKYYGESEEEIRDLFEKAEENSPTIIFFDELDSIAPKRKDSDEMERRVVSQLLSAMDGLEAREEVIVIGATNRIDSIDPALRRGGRFDREIEIGVPDKTGRKQILEIHSRGMPTSEDIDLEEYADRTHGFVGADIESFVKEAAMSSLREVSKDIDPDEEIPSEVMEEIEVTKEDFEHALKVVEPSAMREFFMQIPDVSYDDVGGLEDAKQELTEMIEWPLKYKEMFDHMNTEAPTGILLHGPPGTGKTLLAKAVANASNSNFIPVKGPELLNKYVGESEKAVREVFEKAKQNSPSIIFFDEIDSIAPRREGSSETQATERVVSQLLTELDGIEDLKDVVVIATTNRPDIIDEALLRPGRLDRSIEIPTPNKEAIKEIFKIHLDQTPINESIDLDELTEEMEGLTGSDIESIVTEASLLRMREHVENNEDPIQKLENLKITEEDLRKSIEKVKKSSEQRQNNPSPSIPEEELEKMQQQAATEETEESNEETESEEETSSE